MNATAQPHGRYEQDPMPFVALMAIAAGAFVSLPALVLGIALAPLARRARIVFALLALVGFAWVALAWSYVSLEMHRAHLAGARAGMFLHVHAAFDAAWPHIRHWQAQAAPLCFTVALGIVTFRRRTVEELRERTSAAPTVPAAAPNAARAASSASASSRAPRPSSSSASTSEEATCSRVSAAGS